MATRAMAPLSCLGSLLPAMPHTLLLHHHPCPFFRYRLQGSHSRRMSLLRRRAAPADDDGAAAGGRRLALKNRLRAAIPAIDSVTVAACLVGLLTGLAVVLFNIAVHEIRDITWDGIPLRGASWLREEPLEEIWTTVVFVPTCGGIAVGILNALRNSLSDSSIGISPGVKGALEPFLKALAASFTLGTGNSLGPEGPSVEIGSSIAKGFGNLYNWDGGKKLSLVAAGSASGISSGFNAAVAGCFFAVESVVWPSSADSSSAISNSTPIVILSAVIASVVSEVGLGSDPTFTVPQYDFRSPSELPLYLLLGILCGLVSIALAGCTSVAVRLVANLQRLTGLPKFIFPALGSFTVGLMCLFYPEVLYWGFENVDILLESRPFTNGLSAAILVQLIGVKVVATSLSRASGLVGGYYAPSLFIGAATGMAYGKLLQSILTGPNGLPHLSILEVASPQAYGLVGMAATLASVCRVPLTSVLLLFELTHDYRIVLPLLGAVGLSSWISSRQNRVNNDQNSFKDLVQLTPCVHSGVRESLLHKTRSADLCKLESSLCLYDTDSTFTSSITLSLTVAHAMKTRFLFIYMETSIDEAVNLMLKEKQSIICVVDINKFPLAVLALEDIKDYIKFISYSSSEIVVGNMLISHVCKTKAESSKLWVATPDMMLKAVNQYMELNAVEYVPVVAEYIGNVSSGPLVGFIDRECIDITVRAVETKELLGLSSKPSRPDH